MLVLKVVEPDESDPLPKLSATAKCPECKHLVPVNMTGKKLVGGNRGKLNWNICNFQSHFKMHCKLSSSQRQLNIDASNAGITNTVTTRGHNSNGSSEEVSDENSVDVRLNGENETAKVSDPVDDPIRLNISGKRKYNVISDSEDESLKENAESGEFPSGVLKRQNAPEL